MISKICVNCKLCILKLVHWSDICCSTILNSWVCLSNNFNHLNSD